MNRFLILFIVPFFSFCQVSDFYDVNFQKMHQNIEKMKDASLRDLASFSNDLTEGLETDIEKFKAIFKWVALNIKSDYSTSIANISYRDRYKDDPNKLALWNQSQQASFHKKLLFKKTTVCTGYAYLVKRLCDLNHIQCEIVNGYAKHAQYELGRPKSPNHSWIAVKINEKWYLGDPAWANGYIQLSEKKFEEKYQPHYFLPYPDSFGQTHHAIDSKFNIQNHPKTLEDFLAGPLVYKNAYQFNFRYVLPKTMEVSTPKNKTIQFKFKTKKLRRDPNITLKLVNNGVATIAHPNSITKQDDETYTFNYTFIYTGNYDVHLKINSTTMCTYVVTVLDESSN